MRLIFISIFIGISSLMFSLGHKELFFRPVRLKIVDAITNKPIKGVKVYNVNVTYIPKRIRLFGIPIGESKDLKSYYLSEFYSDENGLVEIPEALYSVKKNSYLYGQDIFINVELYNNYETDEKKAVFLEMGLLLFKPEKKIVFMPKSEYKSYWILSRPYPLDHRWDQSEATKPYYTQINNGHEIPPLTKKEKDIEPRSFFCEEEEFVILLEKQGR